MRSATYICAFSISLVSIAGWAIQSNPVVAQVRPAIEPLPETEQIESSTLTLDEVVSLALSSNPTLCQSCAAVDAARGAAYQAGRYPNPVIGYVGDQIGIEGTAGELQGGFISQEFVTGGKLQLSQAKYCQRVRIAQTNFDAQQIRVRNDVSTQFYHALAAQQLVQLYRQIVDNGRDNVQTHVEMLNLGQTNQPGLLQAEVALQRDILALDQADNELAYARRKLASLVGLPELETSELNGDLALAGTMIAWESAIDRLLSGSPELAVVWEEIRHDRLAVQREYVEPIPDILVDVSGGRNFETNNTVAGVSVGIPLPLFDRNRGTIRQAQADLARTHAEARRLELALRARLADQYQVYQTSWQRVAQFRDVMLPKAKQSLDLLRTSYSARRVAWPEVLMAQRMYLELQVELVENQARLREMEITIQGMLLTGGLTEPPGPLSAGHIDAVSKPR